MPIIQKNEKALGQKPERISFNIEETDFLIKVLSDVQVPVTQARLAWYIALDMFKERDVEGALEEINLMLDGVEESYRDLGRDFNTQYFFIRNVFIIFKKFFGNSSYKSK